MTLLQKPVIELAWGLALAAVLSEATEHKWSVTARYEARINFEADNYVTQSGRLYLSKALQKVPISFTVSIKKPFNTGAKDYQVNFVLTYFVPSKKPQ